MTKASDEVRRSLVAQLAQLEHEAVLIRNALAVLDGGRAPAPAVATAGDGHPPAAVAAVDVVARARPARPERPARPARPARRRRARRKLAGEVVPAGKLELLLSGSDGLTTSALAEQAGGDRDQVLTLLRELETSGRIRRSGERRSTRWHAITDEDRIAERAAELASRTRAS
jgi:hypothetical protein